MIRVEVGILLEVLAVFRSHPTLDLSVEHLFGGLALVRNEGDRFTLVAVGIVEIVDSPDRHLLQCPIGVSDVRGIVSFDPGIEHVFGHEEMGDLVVSVFDLVKRSSLAVVNPAGLQVSLAVTIVGGLHLDAVVLIPGGLDELAVIGGPFENNIGAILVVAFDTNMGSLGFPEVIVGGNRQDGDSEKGDQSIEFFH